MVSFKDEKKFILSIKRGTGGGGGGGGSELQADLVLSDECPQLF
jgi:hypothetical protein